MAKDTGFTYTPAPPAGVNSPEELLAWALQELEKLSIVVNNLAEGRVAVAHRAPDKPRNGYIRYADGTDWNPGSGRGYYGFDETTGTWKFLG